MCTPKPIIYYFAITLNVTIDKLSHRQFRLAVIQSPTSPELISELGGV